MLLATSWTLLDQLRPSRRERRAAVIGGWLLVNLAVAIVVLVGFGVPSLLSGISDPDPDPARRAFYLVSPFLVVVVAMQAAVLLIGLRAIRTGRSKGSLPALIDAGLGILTAAWMGAALGPYAPTVVALGIVSVLLTVVGALLLVGSRAST